MYKPSEIDSFNLLSSFLRTAPESLNAFVNGFLLLYDSETETIRDLPKYKPNGFYSVQKFYIPKKNKALGFREVYKLKQQFAVDILKVLKYNLDDIYQPENCVHGFVKGRSTLSNAKCHIGKKYLLKLDIKHFFDSINKETVVKAFVSIGFPGATSEQLSKICTINNHLAQGYPTSPVIANIVCEQLDKELNELCGQQHAVYTRYADDISISSDFLFKEKDAIEKILSKFGFELNELKSQRFKYGQNQYVTGLSISDSLYPRIPKPLKRRIRQQIYYIKKFGYVSHICRLNDWDEETESSIAEEEVRKTKNQLKGWIDYIHSIEPQLAIILYDQFNEIEVSEFGYDRNDLSEKLKEWRGKIEFKTSTKKKDK